LNIKSPVFENNAKIPLKYTCDGENINPPLEVLNIPKSTKSLVLVVDDPDAPAGDWVHWTLWNISPETTQIQEGSVPAGATEGVTDFGKPGYGGPCPPNGQHRYFFKLFALDIILTITSSSTKKDLEEAIKNNILEKSELIGLYSRVLN